jgi:hypothetical protein
MQRLELDVYVYMLQQIKCYLITKMIQGRKIMYGWDIHYKVFKKIRIQSRNNYTIYVLR